jgi:hypothetical protein
MRVLLVRIGPNVRMTIAVTFRGQSENECEQDECDHSLFFGRKNETVPECIKSRPPISLQFCFLGFTRAERYFRLMLRS